MALDFTEKVGPLPVWAWGLIGGAGLAVAVLMRGSSAKAQPLVLQPLPAGNVEATSPLGGLGSLLGGLSEFICTLPNSPNALTLELPDGTQLSFQNGVPTYGQTGVILSGEQTTTGPGRNPCKPPPVPPDEQLPLPPPAPEPVPAPSPPPTPSPRTVFHWVCGLMPDALRAKIDWCGGVEEIGVRG
jgi:hypothetical protein